MRTRFLTVAVVLLPVLGWPAGSSLRNPAIRSPVGVATAPVSNYRGGLVTTPVPIDATADLSMTGNLRGGKAFRGNVPYRSTSDIGLNPGSSSINSHRATPSLSSFLRDAAGPEDIGRRSAAGYGARPYYSPSEAVARTVPGGGGVFAPRGADESFAARRQRQSAPTSLFALESGSGSQVLQGGETTATAAGLQRFQTQHVPLSESLTPSDGTFVRGLSAGLSDVERLTPAQAVAARRHGDRLKPEHFREQSRRPLLDARGDSAVENRGVLIGDGRYQPEASGPIAPGASVLDGAVIRSRFSPADSFKMSSDSVPGPGNRNDFATSQFDGARETPGYALPSRDTVGSQPAPGERHGEILGRIKRQLDELNRSVESRLKATPGDGQNVGASASADSSHLLTAREPRVGSKTVTPMTAAGGLGHIESGRQNRFESRTTAGLDTAQKIRSLPDSATGIDRAEISVEAKRVMGRHKSPDSFAADKFSQHLRAAEDHLRAGKYYKAADSFAMASVYRSDDPRALAGRSHALFAAGEYVSSALFLSRALAVSPEHAKVRIDFVTILGGSNRLAGRIADIEQWFSRSGSGQLQLLLGYVYCQAGRLNEAGRAIETARAKMPRSVAVAAITAAINDAAARR